MATATQTSKILSAEQEAKLRQPIDEYVGKIQAQIDELRTDGTEKAVNIQNELDNLKRDRIYTAQEKTERETKLKAELAAAKAVEEKNKGQINKLIVDAEAYLKAHYDSDYYQAVVASCKQEKVQAQQKYQATVEQLKKEHETALSKLSNQQEIKDEKYVHKNRLFDAKMQLDKDCQAIKDRRHAAFDYKYHLIDMLRLSKFTVGESLAQKWENYKYTFNRRDFLLRNGLYIAIVIIFIILCLIAQFGKKVPLLTVNNILNILQQASPRMFLALGVAGLILLAGTDLSIGRLPLPSLCTRESTPVRFLAMCLILPDCRSLPALFWRCLSALSCAQSLPPSQVSLQPSSKCTHSFLRWRTCWSFLAWSPIQPRVFPLAVSKATSPA